MFEKCLHPHSHADDLYHIYFQTNIKDLGNIIEVEMGSLDTVSQ